MPQLFSITLIFPFATGGTGNCWAKILQRQGEQKQQGKMETLKDITKSSHMESSENMGGEEREKRHLEG